MTRFPTPGTWPPRRSSPPVSRIPPGRRRAKTRPGTATSTWPGSSARPPRPPASTDTLPRRALPPDRPPPRLQKAIVAIGRSILVIIWHLLSDPEARYTDLGSDFYATRSTPNAASAATSASSKPSATQSSSNAPPDQQLTNPAPLRSAGRCRAPSNSPIFGLVLVSPRGRRASVKIGLGRRRRRCSPGILSPRSSLALGLDLWVAHCCHEHAG